MLQQRRRDDHLHSLELNPWRDGCDFCIEIVEEKASSKNVSLVRHYAADEVQEISVESLDSLLDTIGNALYDLQSMSIQLPLRRSLSSSPSPKKQEPSLSAITTFLATCYHVHTVTLIGLDWMESDELDMNGWYEAIRIHPTLQSLEIRQCQFAKRSHLDNLKKVAFQRKRNERWSWKHLDISENTVAATAVAVPAILAASQQSRILVLLVGLLLLFVLLYYAYLVE
jgi:hypothetical protein